MPAPTHRHIAPRCSIPDCTKQAQTRQLCKAHGGGVRCRSPNCPKLAQSRGLCVAHGGGRRCQFDGCGKLAQYKGLCLGHGGGRRCRVPECTKYVQVRGCCKAHSKLLEAAEVSTRSPSGVSSPSSKPASKTATGIHALSVHPPESATLSPSTTKKTSVSVSVNNPRLRDGGRGFDFNTVDFKPQAESDHSLAGPEATSSQRVAFELYRPACRRLYCQKRTSNVL